MTKIRKPIWIAGVLLIVTIIATIFHNPKSPGTLKSGTSSLQHPPSLSIKVIPIENGWAYEIKIDGNPIIYQDRIPAIPINKPFQTKSDALKCGELVLTKIKENKIPSVTIAELDSMAIPWQN